MIDWIKVGDDLPEIGEKVLATDAGSWDDPADTDFDVVVYERDDVWRDPEEGYTISATYWARLTLPVL